MAKIPLGIVCGKSEADPALEGLKKSLSVNENYSVSQIEMPQGLSWEAIESHLEPFELALLSPCHRVEVSQKIQSLSVNSHLLSYCDFMEKRNGQWWAKSLFNTVFNQMLIEVLKKRDFKGPVIFLGYSPLILPLVEVLGRFGFMDVFFLETAGAPILSQPEFIRATKPMINLKLAMIDSAAFIQSQREYALCFILDHEYSTDVIEDMSYFHFLSARSTIFDVSGGSNFQYDEVKALGVHLIGSEQIAEAEQKSYEKALVEYRQTRDRLSR